MKVEKIDSGILAIKSMAMTERTRECYTGHGPS